MLLSLLNWYNIPFYYTNSILISGWKRGRYTVVVYIATEIKAKCLFNIYKAHLYSEICFIINNEIYSQVSIHGFATSFLYLYRFSVPGSIFWVTPIPVSWKLLQSSGTDLWEVELETAEEINQDCCIFLHCKSGILLLDQKFLVEESFCPLVVESGSSPGICRIVSHFLTHTEDKE